MLHNCVIYNIVKVVSNFTAFYHIYFIHLTKSKLLREQWKQWEAFCGTHIYFLKIVDHPLDHTLAVLEFLMMMTKKTINTGVLVPTLFQSRT